LLEVRDIHVSYGDLRAVTGVSFDVPDGAIVSVIGGNGAGKTTTLNAVSGVLRLTKGEVRLDGRRIDGLDPHQIVDLGIVQVPEGRKLFPTMTVWENRP
jgi:branched-chain amino acid transport system ATP-binding protein